MPHPRKISKNAVDAKSFCMSLIELTSLCPPPTTPHPTPRHPGPSPCIPTHYENTTPFGIPRKPVFPQFLHGFSMRNLGNIVGRGWGRLLLLLLLLLLITITWPGGRTCWLRGGCRLRRDAFGPFRGGPRAVNLATGIPRTKCRKQKYDLSMLMMCVLPACLLS